MNVMYLNSSESQVIKRYDCRGLIVIQYRLDWVAELYTENKSLMNAHNLSFVGLRDNVQNDIII